MTFKIYHLVSRVVTKAAIRGLVAALLTFIIVPQTYSQVPLLNSYEGKVDYLIFKHPARYNVWESDDKVKKKLGLSDSQYCSIPLVLTNYSVVEFKRLSRNKLLKKALSIVTLTRPDGIQILALDSLRSLYQLYNESKTNYGFGSQFWNIDNLVDGGVRREFNLSMTNKQSTNPLEEQTKFIASRKFDVDAKVDSWNKNANKNDIAAFKSLVDIGETFALVLDKSLDIYYSNFDCYPLSVNLMKYCGGDKECEDAIESYVMGNWIQDVLYGIESDDSNEGKVSTLIRNDEIAGLKAPMHTVEEILDCNCKDVEFQTNRLLDIQGGNIQVGNDFVLMNREVLENRYLDTVCTTVQRRLDTLGINWRNQLHDSITARVTKKLSYIFSKSVFWFGLDTARQRYGMYLFDNCTIRSLPDNFGFSPFYHLDVSLMLLGQLQNKDSGKVYCLLSMPDMKYQKLRWSMSSDRKNAYRQAISDLKQFVWASFVKLQSDMRKKDIFLEPICVPIPLVLSSNNMDIKEIASFANGVMENSRGNVRYFVPDYSKFLYNLKDVRHRKALKTTINTLKSYGVQSKKVALVQYRYKSGLHCNVKVLKRK